MRKQMLVALTTLMMVGLATTANGDGIVKVSIGSEQLGVELPASSARSVQEVVSKMGGFSTYDEKSGKLSVVKPDVNILLVEAIQRTAKGDIVFSNPIEGWLDKDIPRNFGVFVEVDNAPATEELTLKLVLVGPDGEVVDAKEKPRKFDTSKVTSFFLSDVFLSTKLEQYGTYKVQVLMKRDEVSPFVVVGENRFTVGR
ncbi:hypothetical protein LOK74_04960 [Brevibacillus humidisoli]|uniref:hypothetical protein n=1 Tax=Brevibacillus humidisoli TaxID=2895522 RepID=UPI001E3860CA|nr:hypothetical protein [Brevibacillus humidisoli]UFJ41856.1 hypothetical protein LOK74_04960 [Brevibacillus humidisoli]